MISITFVMVLLNGVYFGFVRNGNGGIWARYAVMQLIVGIGQPFCKCYKALLIRHRRSCLGNPVSSNTVTAFHVLGVVHHGLKQLPIYRRADVSW